MKAKLIVIATLLGFIGVGIWSLASPVIAGQAKIHHQQIVKSTSNDNDQELNDDQKETEGSASELGVDNDRETNDNQNEAENGSADVNDGTQAGGTGEHGATDQR